MICLPHDLIVIFSVELIALGFVLFVILHSTWKGSSRYDNELEDFSKHDQDA